MQKVPCYTTLSGAAAVAEAIALLKAGSLEVRPLFLKLRAAPALECQYDQYELGSEMATSSGQK